jgi:hypothetical protein
MHDAGGLWVDRFDMEGRVQRLRLVRYWRIDPIRSRDAMESVGACLERLILPPSLVRSVRVVRRSAIVQSSSRRSRVVIVERVGTSYRTVYDSRKECVDPKEPLGNHQEQQRANRTTGDDTCQSRVDKPERMKRI